MIYRLCCKIVFFMNRLKLIEEIDCLFPPDWEGEKKDYPGREIFFKLFGKDADWENWKEIKDSDLLLLTIANYIEIGDERLVRDIMEELLHGES